MSDPRSNFRWLDAEEAEIEVEVEIEVEAEGGNVSVSGSLDAVGIGSTQAEKEERTTGTAPMRGNLDDISFDIHLGWVARGWAVNDGDPESPVEIEIVEGELVLGRGIAAEFREDLKEAGIGTGAVAFAIELPWEIGDREQHLVSLRRVGSNAVIVPPSPVRIKKFIGFLDRVDSVVVAGWACDVARIGTPVAVEIYVDGEVAGHAIADQFRPDLDELGLGSASYGFEWLLPERFADGQPHRVEARVANAGAYLDRGITDFLLLPDRLTPEARRLFGQREATKGYLSVIEQALKAEARRPRSTEVLTMTDLLLDSLDPPPVFQTEPAPAGATEVQPD